MDIHPISTESDYLAALKTAERYFDDEPDPASEAGEHFEILLTLIQAYEAKCHPIEAIKLRINHAGTDTQKNKEICIKCGELIHANVPVHLKTIMQINKFRPEDYAEKIIQLEGLPRDMAQDFVDHQMSLNCNKSEPPCAKCGSPLKTWHAIHCLKCDWKRDPCKALPTYYKQA